MEKKHHKEAITTFIYMNFYKDSELKERNPNLKENLFKKLNVTPKGERSLTFRF